jgi:hypothetical protein
MRAVNPPMMVTKLVFIFFATIFSLNGSAQKIFYKLEGSDPVQSKNYYLLTLLETDVNVKALLSHDPVLSTIAENKYTDLAGAQNNCKGFACITERMKFKDEEIVKISTRLQQLGQPGSLLDRLVKEKLIPSFTYHRDDHQTTAELLVKAWEQDARGINHTIAVYGEGKAPNYPQTDSISFNTKMPAYNQLMHNTTAMILGRVKNNRLFFAASLASARLLLAINDRENAADFEPMEETINKAAIRRIGTINWKKFAATLILVPGAGPENYTTPLSAEGMERCRVAANLFTEGMAPFIMVSGGRVHPFRTKFTEAAEMKKYLVANLHIPAEAIVVEPHARHTTTNIRNGVRLIYRYGIPADRPFLTSTSASQSYFLTVMSIRCKFELGYIPYRPGKRLSDEQQEFYPLKEALQINADEPLDP